MVKNLEAIETIGATSIILCDKTGTLTKNQLSVAHVWVDNQIGSVDSSTNQTDFDTSSPTWKNLARVAALTSKSEFTSGGGEGKFYVQKMNTP